MYQPSKTDSLRDGAREYVEHIAVPTYDERAVGLRVQRDSARRQWRGSRFAIAAAATVFVFLLFDGRNVLAQAEQVFRAFVSVNGHTAAAKVNSVTLDQARRDMPFTVIAPVGLPTNLRGNIQELVPPLGATGSSLMFTYGMSQHAITITESSNTRIRSAGNSKIGIVARDAGSLPKFPPLHGPGPYAFFNDASGKLVKLHPVVWTVEGTRIVLLAPPGMLTDSQIARIKRLMR